MFLEGNLRMRKNLDVEMNKHIMMIYRWPMIFWSMMIYFLASYFKTEYGGVQSINSALFFNVVFLHLCLNFFSRTVINFSKKFFISAQFILIVLAGILLIPSEVVLYMGMLPVIGLQLLTLFNIEFKKMALLLVPLQVVFLIIEWVNFGPLMALIVLQASTFLNVIIFLAWRFYQRQVSELVKTQHLLDELQLTYTEVKEISKQNERNRIGRDLHDTLMQGLAGVTMQLEGIKSLMASDKTERASEEIEKTISLSRTTLKEAREIVFDMRKDNSKNINLYDRLELLSKVFYENYGLSVRIKSTSDMRVSEDVYEEVSRIISESLTNVVRHCKTDVAIVKIDMDDQLRISIIDYGVGFNVENGKRKHKHFGLKSIQERVEQLEGKLLVKSHIGEGTEIQIQIPTKLRWQNDQ